MAAAKPTPESVIASYRWAIFDTSEPKGVRTVRGYIIILEERTVETGAPLEWVTSYHDADGRPKHRFTIDERTIFQSAAGQALAIMLNDPALFPNAAAVIVPMSNVPPA